MKAIISDIHGNLEALTAVLKDIAEQPVDAIYCLGDIVGYGTNPRECLRLVEQHCQVVLLGNHDQAVLSASPEQWVGPSGSAQWTRSTVEAPVATAEDAQHRIAFLAARPLRHSEEGTLFVHGSPRDPLNEYVFPLDVHYQEKMEAIFSHIDRCCFAGHTHLPGVFAGGRRHYRADELPQGYHFRGQPILCNVGSVGQPRDGDWRACYALYDSERILFRRVVYDREGAESKRFAVPELLQ
jgi:predicted phosphodiesterase